MTSEHYGALETASLDISIQPGPVAVIRGEIDIASGPQLRDQLLRAMRRHAPRLALDLTGVTFIDCAGINVLLAARRHAQLDGGWLRVIRASPRVHRVLELADLLHVLMPTALPDALASQDSVARPIALDAEAARAGGERLIPATAARGTSDFT
jgi:anti-anti-sigma factor